MVNGASKCPVKEEKKVAEAAAEKKEEAAPEKKEEAAPAEAAALQVKKN